MTLLGALALAAPSDDATVEKEARALAAYIVLSSVTANRSGRTFILMCPPSPARDYVEFMWQSPQESKKYASNYGCSFSRYGNKVVDSYYYPQWQEMVPQATIQVKRGDAYHFVIVHDGKARTSRTQPN